MNAWRSASPAGSRRSTSSSCYPISSSSVACQPIFDPTMAPSSSQAPCGVDCCRRCQDSLHRARLGNGRVVTIDRDEARRRDPSITTVLSRAGVPDNVVEVYFEPRSYNWRLMRFLEEGRGGTFDFVHLDGAHTWKVDGLANYLALILLRPGGWILFDDLKWASRNRRSSTSPECRLCRRTKGRRPRCARSGTCWLSEIRPSIR